jgi:hypothetical protein
MAIVTQKSGSPAANPHKEARSSCSPLSSSELERVHSAIFRRFLQGPEVDRHVDPGEHITPQGIHFTVGRKEGSVQSLYLCLEGKFLVKFFYLLQRGFGLKTRVGISVKTALTQEFGLDAELLDKIQTVFLDGKAVDDFESSIIRDGSILALSAAMPGLVGATLRRGSFYAAMRSHITSAETGDMTGPKEGRVTLKLFNLVINELGPVLLEKGVLIEKDVLQGFLAEQSADFWMSCKEARVNGCQVECEIVPQIRWPDAEDLICLEVKSSGSKESKRLEGES